MTTTAERLRDAWVKAESAGIRSCRSGCIARVARGGERVREQAKAAAEADTGAGDAAREVARDPHLAICVAKVKL